ncbi:Alpha-L-arabinofuranosidase C-terminus [Rhizoctonia solani]|uniref:non-reducing end alpha-L-arabinofuranosidase n=1 Tax=Rhizoctonia solani TaxID=456999 RepID=A0A8H7IA89_9AGAM|nr:Alpha-L-arabinofuranosidase C-terminus [Rhizoctonia solani]
MAGCGRISIIVEMVDCMRAPSKPCLPGRNSSYSGATTLDVTNSIPGVSTALPNSLQATVQAGSTGQVGFDNRDIGFLHPDRLRHQNTFGVRPDVKNVFRVTVDGASASGNPVYFGMFSLFPPTYKGRQNGMRIDLAESLAGTKPGMAIPWWKQFRRSGHCKSLEKERDYWAVSNKIHLTPGVEYTGFRRLENRPGRQGDWGPAEYLNWAEDIGAEPILGIWAGYSLTGETVPESQLQPYIQDAINEIQFVTGDAKTNQWAKLRAQYGRTAPYKVKYIEIGNEDFFVMNQLPVHHANSSPFTATPNTVEGFRQCLKAAFPNSGFEYIATTYPSTALDPAYTFIDWHQYNIPQFIDRALEYDTYPRNGTQIFVGEYAVTSTNASCIFGTPACGRLELPTLQGAVAEAAYMTGIRMSSLLPPVRLFLSSRQFTQANTRSADAPTLQNVNGYQWTPDIVSFDAGSIVKSASYYVQQMFGTNLGTHVLKTAPAPSASVPLHWVASHDTKKKVVYLKASNTGKAQFTASFALDFPITGQSTVTLLSAPIANTSNTLANTDAVVPKTTKLNIASGATTLNYTFPAQSVAVFNLKVGW